MTIKTYPGQKYNIAGDQIIKNNIVLDFISASIQTPKSIYGSSEVS